MRGVIVTLEEAQGGHVDKEVGGGVKVVGNWKVLLLIVYRAQMLCKTVPKSAFGLTDVEETTSGGSDTVGQVGGSTGEPLSDLKRLFGAFDRGEEGGVGAVDQGD
eukprot:g31590.t1